MKKIQFSHGKPAKLQECVDPELWDVIVLQRCNLLPQYYPDSNLIWNRTREELDDEADRRFGEQMEAEEEEERGRREAAI